MKTTKSRYVHHFKKDKQGFVPPVGHLEFGVSSVQPAFKLAQKAGCIQAEFDKGRSLQGGVNHGQARTYA